MADLKSRGKVRTDAIPDRAPLDWLITGDVGSVVEAAYRYALHSEGVTAVMCGTIEESELAENVGIFQKGPLPKDLISKLRDLFGEIDEPIGN